MRNDLLRLVLAGLLGFATTAAAAPAWAQDDDDDAMMGDDDDGGATADDDDDSMAGDGSGDGSGDGAAAEGAADGADAMTGKKGIVLPPGKIMIAGGILINMSSDQVFKPLSINPDIWYGVMDKLMAGLVHSPQAFTGFYAGAGGGLCITGDMDGGCPDVYDSPGLVARYELMNGQLDMAADGGLLFVSLSEFTLALKAGVHGRYTLNDKMAIWFNPNIWLGLTDRSVDVMGVEIPINKERLHLPVAFTYAVSPELKVGAQTGIGGFLDGFGDSWFGELGMGAFYDVSNQLQVGAVFAFTNLYGEGGGGDGRTLQLTGSFLL